MTLFFFSQVAAAVSVTDYLLALGALYAEILARGEGRSFYSVITGHAVFSLSLNKTLSFYYYFPLCCSVFLSIEILFFNTRHNFFLRSGEK